MLRFLYIVLLLAFVAVSVLAQESRIPQRTPIDIARKQTEMLIRELDIHDSLMRDTLYKMHLKYARLQFHSTSRDEAGKTLQLLFEELKNILTTEQYERFVNRLHDGQPRAPKHTFNWLAPPQRQHQHATPSSVSEALDTQLLQPSHLSKAPQ